MESLETTNRQPSDSLEFRLLEEPFRFDFYQAAKLLEQLYLESQKDLGKDPVKIIDSEFYKLHGGSVNFKSNISPSFPASEIEGISFPLKYGDTFEMLVNFLGLAGITGPLPPHYTHWIMESEKENPKNRAFRDFLDLFNNKLIHLLYRIRKKHRVGYEQSPPEKTSIAQYVFSLLGMGTDNTRNRLSINDRALLRYASLLSQKNKSVSTLEFVLADYFNLPVKITSFMGRWREIPDYLTTKVGSKGQNNILGENSTLGKRNWDQGARFNVLVGPLTADQFYSFLPIDKQNNFKPLYELTRHFTGPDFDFEFTFLVKASELQPVKLGNLNRCKLGWTTWIPPIKKSIFDLEQLLFIESNEEIKMELEDGEKLRLGWTVWVPDEKDRLRLIEVKIATR